MRNHNHPASRFAKRGIALDDPQAHQHDHRHWSRRTFLRQVGLAGTASFLLGRMPLSAITGSPLAMALASGSEDRILVLIRLKGGNDGLNTVIPIYDYGRYASGRAGIAIPQAQTFSLSAELAMPNTMSAMQTLWQSGQMKVVNNVGYDDHSLSHFRSTDIWASGADADQAAESGWLGRLLDRQFPDFLAQLPTAPPTAPPAIQMGNAGNLVFNNADGFDMSLNVSSPEQLYEIAQTGRLYDPFDVPTCHYGDQLAYLRSVANSTFRYAEIVSNAYAAAQNSVEYDDNPLARQLALVARLIRGGLGTRLYMVVHDGFDTHANQTNAHATLVQQLSRAVANFHSDLADGGQGDKVLSMTFSEFGRRVEQNASGGTDHGTAAPLFLFGEGLNGNGLLGGLPDLQNLDADGNLRYTTDFRSIYATLLEQWLCIDATLVDDVLGETYERLGGLGLSCQSVPTKAPAQRTPIALEAYYHQGYLHVQYDLPTAANVDITLFNMLGQPLRQVYSGYAASGGHRHQLPLSDIGWAAGVYACTVRVGGEVHTRQISLVAGR